VFVEESAKISNRSPIYDLQRFTAARRSPFVRRFDAQNGENM
jgi:hypothetical protein